jgi:glycosyltransferase involved in cell wall biosynthesis
MEPGGPHCLRESHARGFIGIRANFRRKPVKTLLLAPDLFTGNGGIQRILRLYLKALCDLSGNADSVRFVSLNDARVDSAILGRYSGPRLVEWEACEKGKLRFCRAALKMALRSDRIICGHIAQLPVAWAASLIRPRLSYYLVAHGIEVWRPFTFLEQRALRRAKRIWCVSEYTRQQLLRHAQVPAERTAILHNALDPFLDPASPPPPPEGPPSILSISRLTISDSYKGIGHLIAAMRAVLDQIPDARLRIVGQGNGLEGLRALAREHGVSDAVVFAGFRSDPELVEEFAGSRLFALPSEKEGFGLVFLEAMAHGRPCLGARSGGVPEVITDETGVLVEYGDVPGMAAAIVAALRRVWPMGPLLERAEMFSYLRFKERFASLLVA